MTIEWLTAFIDMPADRFDAGTDFWAAATSTDRSPLRGEHQEFATLVPTDGDAHLRVQRTMEGEPGIHIDLHVADIAAAAEAAQRLGAHIVADDHAHPGVTVMSSPGGMIFCLVNHRGEATAPAPLSSPAPNRLNQICLDIPSSRFETECAFWSELTGWALEPGRLNEFVFLARPQHIPMRLLLQRLGDETGTVHAHLDLGCGSAVESVVQHHNRLGAEPIEPFEYWTTMRDPTGQLYCLTSRDPDPSSSRG